MTKTFADYGIDVDLGGRVEQDTTCPKCSHERKKRNARCLSVNVEKGTAVCHHCAWTVGLATGEQRGEIHWRKPAYRAPAPLLASIGLSDKARAWLIGRGINDETLRRNQITSASVYFPQLEEHAIAVVFPYFRAGELVNRKYRDGAKNFRMEPGAERILYGLDDIEPERVIVVEGEIDKLSVEAVGFTSCVSVPDGAPPPDAKNYASKFSFLESAEEKLKTVSEFILAVDADEPGRVLEEELARRLGRGRCRRVRWPADVKDANECLVKLGPEALHAAIVEAEPYPINGAFDVLDYGDRVRQLRSVGAEKGHLTGWRALDPFYTVRPGEFTLVTGTPGSGKSTWLDALVVNLADLHGWRFAVFSPENQPIEQYLAGLAEKRIGRPFFDLTPGEVEQALNWLHQHFTVILPDDDHEWALDRILEIAGEVVFRKGIRGLVVDPWNELEHLRPQHMSETEYISASLKRLRQFGRRHGVHVWIVAHPAKLYRSKDGQYPVPTLYDVASSAHWRNKCDNGIVVWRDLDGEDKAEVQIHVQKIRFRQVGKRGAVSLYYDGRTATYWERMEPPAADERYR